LLKKREEKTFPSGAQLVEKGKGRGESSFAILDQCAKKGQNSGGASGGKRKKKGKKTASAFVI